jgi:hypothetical protein
MTSFLDVCRFNPTLGGTTDWTFSSAVSGYQSPAAAGVVNGSTYSYRAESADLTQWEIGTGTYTTATGVLTRTTVLFNSSATGTGAGQSGAGTKITFTAAPQVAIVALAEDLTLGNFGNAVGAWPTFTPTITASSGTFTSVSGLGSFLVIGKVVMFICTITITTLGTAAGTVIMTLPFGTLKRPFACSGMDTGSSGKILEVWNAAGSSTLNIRNGDLTTACVSSGILTISGTYEAA